MSKSYTRCAADNRTYTCPQVPPVDPHGARWGLVGSRTLSGVWVLLETSTSAVARGSGIQSYSVPYYLFPT